MGEKVGPSWQKIPILLLVQVGQSLNSKNSRKHTACQFHLLCQTRRFPSPTSLGLWGGITKGCGATPLACAWKPNTRACASRLPAPPSVQPRCAGAGGGAGACGSVGREKPAVMAAGRLRGLAVAGGGESSESDDDGWEIGYLDRASQVAEEVFSSRAQTSLLALKGPASWNFFLTRSPNSFFQWKYRLLDLRHTRKVFVLPYCALHRQNFLKLLV